MTEALPGGSPGEPRVGRYRLLRLLGRGGQGEVWLAEDEGLQRRVALKLLQGVFVTEDRRLRFRREAESIARLEHPGLAQVLEAEMDGEQPYIAMRFVQGVDLSTSLAQRAVPKEAPASDPEAATGSPTRIEPTLPWVPRNREELFSVLRFFERTARALHAAHESGVLHRDVKPGNIMITPEGQPVLLDFGLARDTSPEVDVEQDLLTREGDVFGTLFYMAPEQLRGEAATLDARADVWALGVTLSEALVGERPFLGSTPLQLAESIERGRRSDPRTQNSVLSTDVSVVLGTALEPNLQRRYASALALAEDLRRIVEYEPIKARPAGPLLRLGRWCRREPAWAAALVVTFVALTVGLIYSQLKNADLSSALDSVEAREFTNLVPKLQTKSPAGALALGLKAVEREDNWLMRSTLYDPLLETTLLREFNMPTPRVWEAHFLSETRLLVGSMGGSVAIFDVHTGRKTASLTLDADVVSLTWIGEDFAFAGLWSGEVVGLALPPEQLMGSTEGDAGVQPIEVLWRTSVSKIPVLDVAAADGRVFCIGEADSVRALDAATGDELGRIDDVGGWVSRLELTADHQRLIVGDTISKRRSVPSRSHVVALLDAATLQPVARIDHGGEVVDFDVAVSAGVLATMDVAGKVRLFETEGGSEIHRDLSLVPGHGRLRGAKVAISADGRRVALGFDPAGPGPLETRELHLSSMLVFDLQNPGASWTAPNVAVRVLEMKFSHDGSQLAVTDVSNSTWVLSAVDGSGEQRHAERTRMTDVRFSKDGSQLASFGVTKTVCLWRTHRSKDAFRLDPIIPSDPRPAVWGRFAVDGRRAVVLERSGLAGAFSMGGPGAPEPGTLLFRVDASSDSSDVGGARVALSASGSIALWVDPVRGVACATDLRNERQLREVRIPGWTPGPLRDLHVSEGGTGQDFVALLVDAGGVGWLLGSHGDAEPVRTAASDGGWRLCTWLGAAPRTRFLLVSSVDEIIEFSRDPRPDGVLPSGATNWEERQWEVPELPASAPRTLQAWEVSPTAHELVAATTIGRVYRWSAASSRLLGTPSKQTKIKWLWYMDEQRVAVASGGLGTPVILGGPEPVRPSVRHESSIHSLAVAVDAGVVMTGSKGSAVLVWDAETGAPLVQVRVHEGPVHSVAAHGERGSLRILSCADDGAVLLPLGVVEVARRVAPRQLSYTDLGQLKETLRGR